MDKQQLIQSFSDIAKEKNIDRTEIGTILEELFKSLIERQYGQCENCDVIVNIDRGELEIYQNKVVVEDVDDPGTEISLKDARKIEPAMQIGDDFVDVIDPTSFGRRLVVAAKQFCHRIVDARGGHLKANPFREQFVHFRIILNGASQLRDLIKGDSLFCVHHQFGIVPGGGVVEKSDSPLPDYAFENCD